MHKRSKKQRGITILQFAVFFILSLLSNIPLTTHASAQAPAPPPRPAQQVDPTPIPDTPLPVSTEVPPTLSLTDSILLTQTITAMLTITPGEAASASQTAVSPAILTATPTPFRYIRVQPREVVRSLLEKSAISALVLAGGGAAAALIRFLVTRLLGRVHPDVQVFFSRLVYYGIWIVAFLGVLRVFEIDVATLTAIVGSIGLALSLSSQDLFKNFIAGVYILVERPFSVGEYIKVGEHSGRVEFVDLRTTKLITEDGKQLILPNTLLMSQVVVRNLKVEEPAEEVQAGGELPEK